MILNVFGYRVPVKRVKGLKERGAMGLYKSNRSIDIDSSLRGADYTETLIHECCHAVFDAVSINTVLSLEMEELIADNIAKCLTVNFTIKKKSK